MPAFLYVLALGAFGLITTELGVIGILPQLGEAFGVSIQTAGWLLTGFALTIAIAGPAMTLLFSRVDRKTSLCLVLTLFVFSNIGSAMAPSFGWLLALRVLPAFVHPVFWSVAMSAAAASVTAERSSQAVAIVFAGMSAGIVLGVPLASFAASEAGWRAAFLAFGALNFIALAAHLLLLPRIAALGHTSIGAQLGVLRKGALWWNLALQAVMTAAVFSIYGYMADYLKEVTGLGPRMIGAMLFLFGLAGVGGTLAAGRLMAHLTLTLTSFLALFACVLLVVFFVGRIPAATIVLVPIWGLVHAAAVPLCQAIVLRAAPEAPEFSNSLFNSFGNIGIALGATLGGCVLSSFGIADLPLASLALLAIAAVIFAVERAKAGVRLAHPGANGRLRSEGF